MISSGDEKFDLNAILESQVNPKWSQDIGNCFDSGDSGYIELEVVIDRDKKDVGVEVVESNFSEGEDACVEKKTKNFRYPKILWNPESFKVAADDSGVVSSTHIFRLNATIESTAKPVPALEPIVPAATRKTRPALKTFVNQEGVLQYLKRVATEEGYQVASEEGKRLGMGIARVFQSKHFSSMNIPKDLISLMKGYDLKGPREFGEAVVALGLVKMEKVPLLVTLALAVELIGENPRETVADTKKKKDLKTFVNHSEMSLDIVQAFRAEWLKRWESKRDKGE